MTDQMDVEQPEVEQRIAEVEQLLDSERPPLAPLGTTTDYRQILLAWARRHGLTLDEALERLGSDPDPMGAAWVDKINGHPESRAVMAASLADPVFAANGDEDDSVTEAQAADSVVAED